MKTLSLAIRQTQCRHYDAPNKLSQLMAAPLRGVIALAWPLLAAVSTITLSVWAAGLQAGGILGAGTWATGFIFLGLAVDNHGTVARLLAITGITLPVIAVLQYSVSPGFIIVGGVVLAAWFAAMLLKRLCHQEM